MWQTQWSQDETESLCMFAMSDLTLQEQFINNEGEEKNQHEWVQG